MSKTILVGSLLSALTAGAPGCLPQMTPEYILDADGRIVIYHGVNVSNYSKHSEGRLPWHTREDFARLNEWGFNLVRYQVFWEAIEPRRGEYDQAYLDATIERINLLAELGIDVMVDLHQDLYAQRFTGNGFPEWTINDDGHPFTTRQPWSLNYAEPAVLASYKNFWSSDDLKNRYVLMIERLLERIDDLPNVLGLDVMNEPWPYPLIGFEQTTLSDLYASIQEMHDRRGFKTRICFEPVIYTSTGVASQLRFKPKRGSVYCAHYYDPPCHEGLPYTAAARVTMRIGVETRVAEALAFGTPLMFNEFGISPLVEGYQDYLRDFLSLMDEHHLGWAYWSYDRQSHSSFGLLDADGRPIEGLLEPLVSVYPQRIAGRNPRWRRSAEEFELVYDPIATNAPTLIFIPEQLKHATLTINGQAAELQWEQRCIVYRNPAALERQTLRITWPSGPSREGE